VTLVPAALGTELLDDPAAPPAAVAESLRHIARSNRWFGGWLALRTGLGWLLRAAPRRPLTLLDVGAGSGDLAERAAAWGARRGQPLRPVALERSPVAARLAARRGLPAVVACGGALPVADRGVDVVIACMVLHHLADESAARLLRACTAAARLGVVVADLRPSALAAVGFRLAGRALGFDAHTIRDGVTSLARGYTRERLAAITAAAGADARLWSRPGARVVAAWRTA